MSGTWIFLLVYAFVFFSSLVSVALWRQRTRRERAPFPDNARLLRGPAESLRRQLAALDERIGSDSLLAFSLPLVVGFGLFWIVTHLSDNAQLLALALFLLGLFGGLFVVIRRLVAGIDRWRNTALGCFGERIVAEALDPLKAAGFRVFHDVPAGDDKTPFNIDHVVVGPSGVFAVETKTRRKRKGSSRPGVAEHEIIYDGRVLAYPWGEDKYGLEQAARQARWLKAWLGGLLGSDIPVQPILTFPGWMVITRASGEVAVLNPRQIPAAVTLRGVPVMSPEQIDLVARQLEARCRDVEF